ncbi:MAG: hypothetical protein ACXVUE_22265 [Solirubrobacteraceae bacterium]
MFSMLPLGWVACPRTEPIDDNWGDVVSRVRLDGERFTPDSLKVADGHAWRHPARHG